LQGEGQEFESPRLHHLAPTRQDGTKNKSATLHRRSADRACVEPCGPLVPGSELPARVLGPADCWAGLRGPGAPRPLRPERTFTSEHVDRKIESPENELRFRSGSPSRRARQCIDMHKDQYPETIRRNRPLGELLKWSSYTGHGVDALAPGADEGRGRRRNASGSCEQALIRRCPNGETRPG
jgi:hypothetical protein